MGGARRRLAALAFGLATLAARLAHASPGDAAPDAARLGREALAEFNLGHWSEALALLEESARRRPSARVQRGIAKCLFEMRLYVRAIAACDRALEETRDALLEELAADVRTLRGRALRFTSEIELTVSPPGARVVIDGQDAPHVQRLDLGTHTIRIEAAGHESQVARFDVASAEAPLRLQFDLRAASAPAGPAKPSFWPPLAGGLVAAAATTAAIVYVADRGGALHDCETLGAQGSGCANVPALERERALGVAATVLGAGAFVLCGYFVVRVLTAPSAAPVALRGSPNGGAAWQLRF